jgi:hypothetical protein
MQRWSMRFELRGDGLMDAYIVENGRDIACKQGVSSGEEAEAAARLYLKEKEAHGVEDTDQTRSVTVPG